MKIPRIKLVFGMCIAACLGSFITCVYLKDKIKHPPLIEVSPNVFRGSVAESWLGKLTQLNGTVVTVTDTQSFVLRDGSGMEHSCKFLKQPNAPMPVQEGSVVVALGFCEISQHGIDLSVSSHLERRQIVIDSVNGSLTEHPGGFGKLRFDEAFVILDLRTISKPGDIERDFDFIKEKQ